MRRLKHQLGGWLMDIAFRLAPGHKVVLPLYRLGGRLRLDEETIVS